MRIALLLSFLLYLPAFITAQTVDIGAGLNLPVFTDGNDVDGYGLVTKKPPGLQLNFGIYDWKSAAKPRGVSIEFLNYRCSTYARNSRHGYTWEYWAHLQRSSLNLKYFPVGWRMFKKTTTFRLGACANIQLHH